MLLTLNGVPLIGIYLKVFFNTLQAGVNIIQILIKYVSRFIFKTRMQGKNDASLVTFVRILIH